MSFAALVGCPQRSSLPPSLPLWVGSLFLRHFSSQPAAHPGRRAQLLRPGGAACRGPQRASERPFQGRPAPARAGRLLRLGSSVSVQPPPSEAVTQKGEGGCAPVRPVRVRESPAAAPCPCAHAYRSWYAPGCCNTVFTLSVT